VNTKTSTRSALGCAKKVRNAPMKPRMALWPRGVRGSTIRGTSAAFATPIASMIAPQSANASVQFRVTPARMTSAPEPTYMAAR